MMHRTLQAAGLMTMMMILSFSSALAIDDGGGRSVFARGAGERALALGGAYGAVADDPGAMIWNPAGLGQLERKNLYASHSNLIGLGFSEQLGLLALPHWKMGTFGLGIRRFGVDGIEGRDDRGTIFDDNLKDSETELILGFGRRLGNAWSLGMSFKYQQHELAGYKDGAPGLDLGVIAKPLQAAGNQSDWADDITLGLAIRNLIEPNLRLDEEGVKDPTGLRFGLAVDRRLSENLQLLVTSDIEKTRDMDTHLHLGAELRVLRLLALRAGSNTGMLTAGVGVNYSNFVCDYAFEDNELESVHRFGLGLAFGGTTTQTRQAKLAAQEANLQKRLTQAFQRESQDRIQTMVAQARYAVDRGRYDEALRMIEACRVLDPTAGGIDALESQAHLGRGVVLEDQDQLAAAAIAYQRCLAVQPDNAEAARRLAAVSRTSDHLAARSAELRDMLDVALAAYARGDLVTARDGFQELLKQDPDDPEARALLDNTLRTLSLQAGLLAEQARTQAKAGNLVSAKAKLDKAKLLDPGHSALDQVARLVGQLEKDQAAALAASRKQEQLEAAVPAQPEVTPPVPEGPSFASLSPKEQAEVADLYRRGLQASEENRQDDAVRYWELVWSRAPDYQKVAENLKQEYLVQGMEAFASGQLDKSIEVWERADEVLPGDPRTQGYLARAYEHRSRIQQIRGED
jgi:tetratricopeptide (TPR) repeat protein